MSADISRELQSAESLNLLVFNEQGLIPAIIQDDFSGEVLMLAWMNREALDSTLTTGRVTFWSRSRGELWRKGDTSGHRQYVRSVAHDCDGDALVIRVDQLGAACHTGDRSCFTDRQLEAVTIRVDHDPQSTAHGDTDAEPAVTGEGTSV